MKTPVVFLIFNRPDLTAKVFEAIRCAQPEVLLIVADSPRVSHPGDVEKCSAARLVTERVDWPCKVLRNYSDTNLGCRRRVASGLTWAFQQVSEAIVLEDDCLPDPTFFPFCERMLEMYRDDKRVMMVTGINFLGEWKAERQSYHFACSGSIWGWASWRRAWDLYDENMVLWKDEEVRNRLRDVYCDDKAFELRRKPFDEIVAGRLDTWDYQWTFARLIQSGLSIVPCRNIVSNIGFRSDATHTKRGAPRGCGTLQKIDFPLVSPPCVVPDREYEHNLTTLLSSAESANERDPLQPKRSFIRELWIRLSS